MKNFKSKIQLLACLSMLLCAVISCNNREKLIIPQRPLILIESTAIEYGLVNDGYKYKWIDKNGYVFYTTESDKVIRLLGDTLK